MAIALHTAEQIFGFACTLIAMQISKRSAVTGPSFVMAARACFAAAILLRMAIGFYMRRRILAQNDRTVFKHRAEPSLFNPTESEEVDTTVAEYDLNELNKALRSMLIQGLVITVLHFKWHALQPLIIHAMGFVRCLLFSPLYRAHIYGMKMLRPFDQNTLFGAAPAAQPAAEPAQSEKRKKKED
ncbi:hypothetical protein PAPHI01_1720 [Pancytospora philotis]|nr:hypothetical protein PAPHI01_1720 [Pancytospora philotis]